MRWRGWGLLDRLLEGIWPGRGPWSHLPPWLRPGWLLGRAWYPFWYTAIAPRVSSEYERELLEMYKRILEEQLRMINERIRELSTDRGQ